MSLSLDRKLEVIEEDDGRFVLIDDEGALAPHRATREEADKDLLDMRAHFSKVARKRAAGGSV